MIDYTQNYVYFCIVILQIIKTHLYVKKCIILIFFLKNQLTCILFCVSCVSLNRKNIKLIFKNMKMNKTNCMYINI